MTEDTHQGRNVFVVTVSNDYSDSWPWEPADMVTDWLNENIGEERTTWIHCGGQKIGLFNAEDANVFRLRFGA